MRYLIVEKELGLFLGVYQNIFLFSKMNIFPIVKVPSFDSDEDAKYYIEKYFPNENKKYSVINIETKDKYVNVIDIIKAGYTDYTDELINFIPMLSGAIH